MNLRINIFYIGLFCAFALLLFRLFHWQVYKGQELSVAARNQYHSGSTIDAPRGEILASDGSWLAASGEAWLVWASLPDMKKSSEEIAEKLAPLFLGEVDEENYKNLLLNEVIRIRDLLEKSGVVWVPLKQKVSREVKLKIESLGLKGIGFDLQEKRIYPEASSAAHILGFVGKSQEGSDTGYFGLEGYYETALSGKPGFLSRESDAAGIPIVLGEAREISAIRGINLKTHIDSSIQANLEEKLKSGIEKYTAASGTAIVMDPKTGAVLGMVAYPSYDPDEYWRYSDELFSNPAISSSFEPGSIFKVLVMAAALDSGAVTQDTICDICSGPVKVDKYSIETWNNEYHPDSTMVDVIVHSDNVGMVFVSRRLGRESFYTYLTKFGLGEITGIDLQGEASPPLRDVTEWGPVELATASFGQGIAVTPIQMIRAVSVIANDGELVIPQVVDEIVDDTWEEDIKPVRLWRVISKQSANEMTSMMVQAAKNGEAKWTHLRGFKVAGKTGTAQIPIAGHYDEQKTIATFVGFAPYDNPKFVMMVTLQEPSSSPWASETAAPLWYSMAKDLFLYFGIQPEN